MSWKKNIFSYLIWFIYALLSGAATVGVAGMICVEMGISAYWGGFLVLVYIACVGGIVFLIHRVMAKAALFIEKNHVLLLAAEAAAAAALLILGLILRIRGIGDVGQSSVYYEAAKVTMGEGIPQNAHVAVYFYVGLLRGVFTLMGNYLIAGIWVQIALQLTGAVVLYLVLRSRAGSIAALTVLGFCTCAPYAVEHALALSPEMLYFCLFMIAIAIVGAGCAGRLKPALFLPVGILAAIYCYADVMGIMLLFAAFAVIFCHRDEPSGFRKRVAAVLLCMAGAVAGFLVCALLDAQFSGISFLGTLQIWLLLYWPESFRMPLAAGVTDSGAESLVLCGLMVFGIFSFWCDRRREKIKPYILAACTIILAGCFGIFTEEMPGYFYLYLLFAVLAGIGIGQSFYVPQVRGVDDAIAWLVAKEEEPREPDMGIMGMMPPALEHNAAASERNAVASAYAAPSLEQNAGTSEEPVSDKKQIKYIENPLPLPKKHVKRVLDYPMKEDFEDYDYDVGEEDDFDI